MSPLATYAGIFALGSLNGAICLFFASPFILRLRWQPAIARAKRNLAANGGPRVNRGRAA